jgi:hypothetical protein
MRKCHLLLPLAGLLFAMAGFAQTYATRFEGVESPLSEGGRWTNNSLGCE